MCGNWGESKPRGELVPTYSLFSVTHGAFIKAIPSTERKQEPAFEVPQEERFRRVTVARLQSHLDISPSENAHIRACIGYLCLKK